MIKVTTAVLGTREEEKSREKTVTHRLHLHNMKITERHSIPRYFYSDYRTQLLSCLFTICHVNSSFYFPNYFCEN